MQNLQQPSLKLNDDQVHIQTKSVKAFKAYPFIIAVMAVLQVSTILYSRYFIDIFGMKVAVGPLIFTPALLYMFQIVSECYGWQYGRQVVWINLCINTIFTLITFTVRFIPISLFTHEGLRIAYQNLMGTVWLTSLGVGLVIFVADYLSSVFTAQGRYYFKGTMIFIRLIIVHLITEALLLSWALLQMPYNGYTMTQAYQSMIDTFAVRLFSSAILGLVAVFVIWVIQHYIEKVVCFDLQPDWNVFDWQINDKSTVKISTKDWDSLPKHLKPQLNVTNVSGDHLVLVLKK